MSTRDLSTFHVNQFSCFHIIVHPGKAYMHESRLMMLTLCPLSHLSDVFSFICLMRLVILHIGILNMNIKRKRATEKGWIKLEALLHA